MGQRVSTGGVAYPAAGGDILVRKILLATATLMALVNPAICADMLAAVYKAPPLAPVWSWTGCYVGGHAGGLWARQKDWIVRTPGSPFFGQSLAAHEADRLLRRPPPAPPLTLP